MLTPQEITEKVFVKAVFGGYDMTGVDDFLEIVSTDYNALYKENAILKGKLKILVEKVEEYRSTEDAMRMALLNAQRMGEEITIEANRKRDELLQNTDAEIKNKLTETAQRIADEELRLNVAAKETAKFIDLSQAIMRKHSEFLAKLEAARRAVKTTAEPPPAAPPPPPPTQEDEIASVAEQIGSAVEKLTGKEPPAPEADPVPTAAPEADEPPSSLFEDEPIKLYPPDSEADSVSPRPKFDFDDLKFGANFDNDE
jgi:cell division initiation protein